jgi:hypothetical protein
MLARWWGITKLAYLHQDSQQESSNNTINQSRKEVTSAGDPVCCGIGPTSADDARDSAR